MNSLSRNEVAGAIVEFVRKETNFDDPALINESTRLLELGIIDSLMTVLVVAYCEESYGCHIGAEDLTEDSLENALALADLVLRVQSASEAFRSARDEQRP
jgi:acyl carrier protein